MALPVRAGANALSVKATNLRLLLVTLLRLQPVARVRLARATGLSTTTVTNLVAELIRAGVIQEAGPDVEAYRRGAGRPPVALTVRAPGRLAVGVHIGVRRARVGLMDLQGNLHRHVESPIEAGEEAQLSIDRTSATIANLLQEWRRARDDSPEVVGIGVGASGLVQFESGVNVLAPNLGWQKLPLREMLAAGVKERLGERAPPVSVDNNVRCMALAESIYGVGRNVRALATVYARVGVGAGLVVDGEIYRGADYGAGEIGHWVMTPHNGELCHCGNRGCLETLISETVLSERAEQIHPGLTYGRGDSLKVIFDAARDGHLGLIELLEERAYYVGLALANLVNVVNPQLIVVGGWLFDAFDLIEPIVQDTVRRHAFGGLGNQVDVLPASFGSYAGVIGAATLAFESFFFSRGGAAMAPHDSGREPWAISCGKTMP